MNKLLIAYFTLLVFLAFLFFKKHMNILYLIYSIVSFVFLPLYIHISKKTQLIFFLSAIPPNVLLITSLAILKYSQFINPPFNLLIIYTSYLYLSNVCFYYFIKADVKKNLFFKLSMCSLSSLSFCGLLIAEFLTEVINGNKHAYLEINYYHSIFELFTLFMIIGLIWHGIKSVYKITKQKFAK